MDNNSLTIFSQGSKMLAEANTIQKTKDLKDLALTAADWAKRKGMGEEAIKYARDYALDAERKMGQMLLVTPKAKGGNPNLPTSTKVEPVVPTLKDIGLTKKESSKAQQLARLPDEQFEEVKSKTTSINEVYGQIKKDEKKKEMDSIKASVAFQVKANNPPVIFKDDAVSWLRKQDASDLLLTDPPYSTDVDDINEFAKQWLPIALNRVKSTGRAYVFIGAYPKEIQAYMAVRMPTQLLVWTYRNTIGPSPKDDYKLNWQAILYYRMVDAPPLDCPIMTEQFSVQDINAPDGRQYNREHTWQKPNEIADRFIRHSTKQGDTVLDPFAGTGTFLLSAHRMGRIGTGCDNNSEMLSIAERMGCELAR